jgi:hypothetical protein
VRIAPGCSGRTWIIFFVEVFKLRSRLQYGRFDHIGQLCNALHETKVGREKEAREKKARGPKSIWTEEKNERALKINRPLIERHKDSMEALREFNEARVKEKEPSDPTAPSIPWAG